MKIVDLFTNAGKEAETDVNSPAFSLTKVSGGLGTLIAAIAVAAAKLEGETAVKIAVIGAGALVMVGYFGLAAVDLIVRQRAAAAKLQFGSGIASTDAASTSKTTFVADSDTLVVQKAPGGQEYRVRVAAMEGDKLTLIAMRDGDAMDPAPSFHSH